MRPHLLLVDDEVTIREVVSAYFSKKGYDVSIAATGSEAMRLADETAFRLVIMDINLAGENGLELLRFFKSNFPKLPVLMFTGMGADDELLDQAMFRGANGFMRKSEPLDNLFAAVKSYVRS
jgi:DNA-binding response OmpR family regulator